MIPYSTDAPLYHLPLATVALIVLNIITFIGTRSYDTEDQVQIVDSQGNRFSVADLDPNSEHPLHIDPEAKEDYQVILVPKSNGLSLWAVEYGKGVRPWQWVTGLFLHADISHLLGNMFFFWAFGLIVEGKVGALIFAALYLGIGAASSGIEQLLMLFSEGGSIGASSAIFGLLAIAMVWAPQNSFHCWLRFYTFSVPVYVFAFLCVAKEIAGYVFSNLSFGSEALHLLGFAVGLPVGLIMLKRGLVDCEGFDLISMLSGNMGEDSTIGKSQRTARTIAKEKKVEDPSAKRNQRQLLENQLRNAIDDGHPDAAVALHKKLSAIGSFPWRQPDLMAIIKMYLSSKEYDKAAPLLEEHIELFADHRFRLQVNLIKIWLHQQRPRHALKMMQSLDFAHYSPEQQRQIRQLAQTAKQHMDAGTIELQ